MGLLPPYWAREESVIITQTHTHQPLLQGKQTNTHTSRIYIFQKHTKFFFLNQWSIHMKVLRGFVAWYNNRLCSVNLMYRYLNGEGVDSLCHILNSKFLKCWCVFKCWNFWGIKAAKINSIIKKAMEWEWYGPAQWAKNKGQSYCLIFCFLQLPQTTYKQKHYNCFT